MKKKKDKKNKFKSDFEFENEQTNNKIKQYLIDKEYFLVTSEQNKILLSTNIILLITLYIFFNITLNTLTINDIKLITKTPTYTYMDGK